MKPTNICQQLREGGRERKTNRERERERRREREAEEAREERGQPIIRGAASYEV